MCEWCEENKGEPIGCQNCGMMICWDHEGADDVISRPYVTTYGDVYCLRCGRRVDADIEEAEAEDAYDYWDYGSSWYDPDIDFENEDSNGAYIGPRDDDEQGAQP